MGDGDPLLARFSQEKEHQDLPGSYSSDLDMWILQDDGAEVPLIEAPLHSFQQATKTNASPEREDESKVGLRELLTKTKQDRERDDATLNSSMGLLYTKTEARAPEPEDLGNNQHMTSSLYK